MVIRKTMPERKRIALVAHDKRKDDLLDWVEYNRELLSRHFLFGTGTFTPFPHRYTCDFLTSLCIPKGESTNMGTCKIKYGSIFGAVPEVLVISW